MFAVVPGVRVASLGHLWAVYSPLSGETILVNDASAAILEILADGPLAQPEVCACLASDTGQTVAELTPLVDTCWPSLIDAGLVRQVSCARHAEAAGAC